MNQMNRQPNLQHPPSAAPSGTVLLSAPFAADDAGQFYYAGSDGAQRLDLLLHLAPYSPLLVVAGKPGVGKTALLRQFISRAHDSWRAAAITARADMSRDDLLREMSGRFGLALDPRIDQQQLYETLITQLRALRQNAQVPILMVDDAQYLSAALMELIRQLCTENDNGHVLSILLFGTPQLQNLLDSPAHAALAARVTHTFEIMPLDEEETGAYLRHRIRAAGAQDDGPFDTMMINRIYAATGGIPARINEMAQRVLSGRPVGEGARPAGGTTARAGGKRLVLLATAIVIALLMVAGPLRTALWNNVPSNGSPEVASGPEQPVIRNPEPVPAAPETDNAAPQPLPPKADTMPEPAVPPAPVQKAPPPAPSAPAEPKTSEPAGEAEKGQAAPALPPEAPPAPTAPITGADWVRAQPDDHFTLQLMALKDEDVARAFITQHDLEGKAGFIPVRRDGVMFYPLFYGSYASRSEAQRAARSLPAKWGVPTPWVRSFRAVHRERR